MYSSSFFELIFNNKYHHTCDQAAFGLEDDITTYEAKLYISSSEVSWRILWFSIHGRYPSVNHLSVHFENGKWVYFTTDKIQNPPKTTLLAFFRLCKCSTVKLFEDSLQWSSGIPYNVCKNNKFSQRSRERLYLNKEDQALGRVYTVCPKKLNAINCEVLHEVGGPTYFIRLKKVSGVVHPTYQSAGQLQLT